MTTTNKLDELLDSGMINEDALTADGFDECVIGATTDGCVVYEAGKMVDQMVTEGMEYNDAIDHFYYNIAGAYVGKFTPIYVWL